MRLNYRARTSAKLVFVFAFSDWFKVDSRQPKIFTQTNKINSKVSLIILTLCGILKLWQTSYWQQNFEPNFTICDPNSFSFRHCD